MSDLAHDDQFNNDVVNAAARHWGISPHAILTMAAARTLPGPIRDIEARNFNSEAREELADLVNYVPWEIRKQQLAGAPGIPVAQQHYLNALGAAVYAFEELRKAQDALYDVCNRCAGPLIPADGEFIPISRCDRCGREVPR